MSTIKKENLQAVLMTLDQNFGAINFASGDKNIASIDILDHTKTALSEFHKLRITTFILVNQDLVKNYSADNLKQFLPKIDNVILYKDLGKTLSALKMKYKSKMGDIMFISEDRSLRGIAVQNGFTAAPHPSVAMLMIANQSALFVSIRGEEKNLGLFRSLIPYFVRYLDNDQVAVLAVMSESDLARAITNRLNVNILNLDLSIEDPMFVSIDKIDQNTHEKLHGLKILSSDGEKILIALGPGEANDSVPFHDMHGHFIFLSPNPTLLRPISQPSMFFRRSEVSFSRWPLSKVKIEPIERDPLRATFHIPLKPVDSEDMKIAIDRYSGVTNLDNKGKITSRHCDNLENQRIIEALLKDLLALGYTPFKHSFSYNSKLLFNVIADLPGIGYFKAEPNLPEEIRKIFLKYPTLEPSKPWVKEVTELTGREWFKEQGLENLTPLELRVELEKLFLENSSWWTKEQPLNGLGSQMVLVCCHLDSTANREAGYEKTVDPAPGADDNGSGLAAVLTIAKSLSQYRGKLTHTIRFCFFNAEEVGLKGSLAYAPLLKDKNIPIKAVINLDMMGYNSDPQNTFEIHAGYYDPRIRDLCLPLAELVKQCAENLGKLGPAQIYKGTIQGGAHDFDRDKFDPAIARSDHFSFQQEGFPACHISEDFFANYPIESSSDPNPNYHRYGDKVIDLSYSSDIASAAVLAIKNLASN